MFREPPRWLTGQAKGKKRPEIHFQVPEKNQQSADKYFLQQFPLYPPQGYSTSFVQKTLTKLHVKISDIKTWYFAKYTSKSPIPNS